MSKTLEQTAVLVGTKRNVPLQKDVGRAQVRCLICECRCLLKAGQTGVCKMRTNHEGRLITNNYGVVSKADLELIEARGFFHFFPGSKVFSLGGFGKNFPPENGIPLFDYLPEGQTLRSLPLEKLARFAIENHCRGVVFTFNEPGMWFEYLVDAVKTVKANGMFTAMITNGFLTSEAVEIFGHYMDGVCFEVNAFSTSTFKRITGQEKFQRVLESAVNAQRRYKAFVEIKTTLIPGINTTPEELRRIAGWIKLVLGENTPWHLSSAEDNTNEILWQAKDIGEEMGLHYVYLPKDTPLKESSPKEKHSFDSTGGGNTYCFNCHRILIERTGDIGNETNVSGLEGSRCEKCRTEINIHTTIWKLK